MRRIKGIVRTVMAIAGAISLNSPLIGAAATSMPQGNSSHVDGTAAKIAGAMSGGDHTPTVGGRTGKFEKKSTVTESRHGWSGGV